MRRKGGGWNLVVFASVERELTFVSSVWRANFFRWELGGDVHGSICRLFLPEFISAGFLGSCNTLRGVEGRRRFKRQNEAKR